MDFFTNLMNSVNGIIWSTALVALCLGAGLYFSIRMGFPQFRLFKEMVRLLTAQNKSGDGITPFQAFAAVLEPGDKILSMRLDQGGHLTHGSPANWSVRFMIMSFMESIRKLKKLIMMNWIK